MRCGHGYWGPTAPIPSWQAALKDWGVSVYTNSYLSKYIKTDTQTSTSTSKAHSFLFSPFTCVIPFSNWRNPAPLFLNKCTSCFIPHPVTSPPTQHGHCSVSSHPCLFDSTSNPVRWPLAQPWVYGLSLMNTQEEEGALVAFLLKFSVTQARRKRGHD